MISGDDFVRAIRKIGYELDHTTGSHMILRHPSRKRLSVPRHRELGRGILTADWARLSRACPEPSTRTNSDRAAHPEEAHSGAEGRLQGLARIANRIVNEVPAGE